MDEEIKKQFAEMQAQIDALKVALQKETDGVTYYIFEHMKKHTLVDRQAYHAYAAAYPDFDAAILAGKTAAEYFKELDAARRE